jgi:tetratricopeptide (TPR) repeat protein
VLDAAEGWLWDHSESATAQDIANKLQEVTAKLEGESVTVNSEDGTPARVEKTGGICSAYINATSAEKRKVEEGLALEAQLAAAERAANGEDDEDHDNRRLKKADRMRMVVKNKEEGTELFQAGNYRMAAARYHKALTHAAKFFDLGPDDQTEVNNLKLSINLNIAQCYLKMENWDQAIRYADESLVLSPTSAKALFRRAAAFESKKDLEKAHEDLKKAVEYAPDDKGIQKALDKVKKLIQKETEKEKKMWSKAFTS